jgi:DNA-binding response OmpR family regulator
MIGREDARRVALVEDDEDLRASLSQMLGLAGFVVDAFLRRRRRWRRWGRIGRAW